MAGQNDTMTNKKTPYWTVGERIFVTAPNGATDVWTVYDISYTTLRVKGRKNIYQIRASRTHADMGEGLGPKIEGEVGNLLECTYKRYRDVMPIKNRGRRSL